MASQKLIDLTTELLAAAERAFTQVRKETNLPMGAPCPEEWQLAVDIIAKSQTLLIKTISSAHEKGKSIKPYKPVVHPDPESSDDEEDENKCGCCQSEMPVGDTWCCEGKCGLLACPDCRPDSGVGPCVVCDQEESDDEEDEEEPESYTCAECCRHYHATKKVVEERGTGICGPCWDKLPE